MTVAQWLDATVPAFLTDADWLVRAHAYCADGLELSIQTGPFAYSTPKSLRGPFTAVEVAVFTEGAHPLELLCPELARTHGVYTVYDYVPIGLIEKIAEEHGGIREDMRTTPLAYEKDYSTRFRGNPPIPIPRSPIIED